MGAAVSQSGGLSRDRPMEQLLQLRPHAVALGHENGLGPRGECGDSHGGMLGPLRSCHRQRPRSGPRGGGSSPFRDVEPPVEVAPADGGQGTHRVAATEAKRRASSWFGASDPWKGTQKAGAVRMVESSASRGPVRIGGPAGSASACIERRRAEARRRLDGRERVRRLGGGPRGRETARATVRVSPCASRHCSTQQAPVVLPRPLARRHRVGGIGGRPQPGDSASGGGGVAVGVQRRVDRDEIHKERILPRSPPPPRRTSPRRPGSPRSTSVKPA